MERLLSAWVDSAYRSPWRVVLTALVLCAVSLATAIPMLGINTDSSEMLSSELPFRQRALALNEDFPQLKDSIIIIIRSPNADEADFAARSLADRLDQRSAAVQSVFAPAADPYLRRHGLLYLDEEALEQRLADLSKMAPFLAELQAEPALERFFRTLEASIGLVEKGEFGQEALDRMYGAVADVIAGRISGTPQALSWQGLLSEEEGINQRLIWLLPKLDFGELQPAKPALKAIDEELALLRPMLHDGTTVGVTGNPALRADELESVVVGIGMSLALSLALVAVLLLIGLRSFAGSAFTIICLIVSIVLTTGFAAIAVGELNLISIAFAVLLIGLGLDFAIHFLLHVREAERSGKKRHHALTGTAKVVGPALALSAPTTAIAFFSFMPTDFVGMAQLGLIGGVGVLIAFVVSMTLLPALLALVRSRPAARVRSPVDPPITGRPRRIGSLLPLLILVLGVAAAAALPFVRFEADPMALRAPESRSVTAFQWLYEEERTVPYRASLLVQSEEEAKAAAAQFQELAVVKAANTVSDLVPENQDAKLDLLDISAPSFLYAIEGPGLDLPTAAPELTPAAALAKRLQDARDGTGAAALAAALNSFRAETELNPEFAEHVQKDVFRYFPQLIELLTSQLDAGFVTVESLPEAMRERFVADDGTRRVEIVPAADMRNLDAREAFVEAVKAVEPEVTGGAVQVVEAGETVASAMLQATLTALVLVVVLIGTLLRDPVRAGLVVIPLALAAFLTCAAGVLFGVPFNYANVIVLPLLIGAGVDSSIHLLLRSGKLSESGRLFSTSTPRAVTFSALTTVAAFGSLALSPHRGTASMGELLAIAIGFMLLTTLTVLPWLITLRRPRSG